MADYRKKVKREIRIVETDGIVYETDEAIVIEIENYLRPVVLFVNAFLLNFTTPLLAHSATMLEEQAPPLYSSTLYGWFTYPSRPVPPIIPPLPEIRGRKYMATDMILQQYNLGELVPKVDSNPTFYKHAKDFVPKPDWIPPSPFRPYAKGFGPKKIVLPVLQAPISPEILLQEELKRLILLNKVGFAGAVATGLYWLLQQPQFQEYLTKAKRNAVIRGQVVFHNFHLRGGYKEDDSAIRKIWEIVRIEWESKNRNRPSGDNTIQSKTLQLAFILGGLAKAYDLLSDLYKIYEQHKNKVPVDTNPANLPTGVLIPAVVDPLRFKSNFLKAFQNIIVANPMTSVGFVLLAGGSLYLTFSANMTKERAFISTMVTSLTGLTALQFQQFMKNLEKMMAQMLKQDAQCRAREENARKENLQREDSLRKENVQREDTLRKDREEESKKQTMKYDKKVVELQTCETEKTALILDKKDLTVSGYDLWKEMRICSLNQEELLEKNAKMLKEIDRLHTKGLDKNQIGTPEIRKLVLGGSDLRYKTEATEIIQKKLPRPESDLSLDEVIPVFKIDIWKLFKK